MDSLLKDVLIRVFRHQECGALGVQRSYTNSIQEAGNLCLENMTATSSAGI